MAAYTADALIDPGSAQFLGAEPRDGGVNFAVYAPAALRVELCLFAPDGAESGRMDLPAQTEGIWHGFVAGMAPGQAYGFRAHGAFEPEAGLRFNPHKLLLDPYARALSGKLIWCDAVFDFDRRIDSEQLIPSTEDSAPFVPKSVVTAAGALPATHCRRSWSETLIYELNVRGYTLRHPAIGQALRGKIGALKTPEVLGHFKTLGITSIELLPIHAFVDEEFLARKGMRNYWGYNSLAFFAADNRYLGGDGLDGVRRTIDALHDANIEVLMDVVYNHTAEGGRLGPSLSFRGLANSAYYRLDSARPGEYINDSGCGNTINSEHAIVRRLIVDSLRYWVSEMGVDGFRFDLAPILGRTAAGFDPDHPLLAAIRNDPVLSGVKLIAEPWDVGPGGYQLGGFPPDWAEWNDQFRDTVRRFWRQDAGLAPDLARRVHGSADIFEANGRGPAASINFIASHDGFTAADLVSFVERHNEANGESNRDGHGHNFSSNHGVEGTTDDALILSNRRRHRLNLLGTLIFSQGTPMLLAGDEFGNSQSGNNNAYAQDNEIGWLDWGELDRDPGFFAEVCEIVRIRRELPLLRQTEYRHGERAAATGRCDIEWFSPEGMPIAADEWPETAALGVLLSLSDAADAAENASRAVCILYNALDANAEFTLPVIDGVGSWRCRYSSAVASSPDVLGIQFLLPGFSIACLSFE